MVDVNKLLGSLLNSGFAGGVAGGLASNLVTSKSGRKMGKSALKYGGIAAVGALAYTAYQRYSNQISTAAQTTQSFTDMPPPPPNSNFLPEANDSKAYDELGIILVRAMIAAARSDGRIDAQESQLIFQKISALGLDSETQNLLVQEMGQPVDIDAIINSAKSPEMAAEIYTVSLLAVEVDTAAEKSYLSMLAARLQLDPAFIKELESQVKTQKQLMNN